PTAPVAVTLRRRVAPSVFVPPPRPRHPRPPPADRIGGPAAAAQRGTGPVVPPPGAVGHDPRRPAGEAGIGRGDPHRAVLQERDRGPDRRHLQLRPRRQRPAVIAATQLRPAVDPAALEQLQHRAAIVPVPDPHIGSDPATLLAPDRPDPLPPARLRRVHLNLRRLITGIGLSDPHITRVPRRRGPRHHLRTDRQPPITDISPVRTQAPIRPVE